MGEFPTRRYVHSFVVVFLLFWGNLKRLSVERKDENKDEFVSVVAQIEKMEDECESENREEEKNITREENVRFGGDGFSVIIIFFFFFS